MKYVSLLLFVFCLGFTWHLAHLEDPISVRTHRELQVAVTEVIQAAVTQQLPNAKDFRFSRLFTRTVDPDTVHTFFGYTFVEAAEGEEQTERNIEGSAVLIRDQADKTKWVLEDIKVDQAAIEFQEGTVIRAGEAAPL